jgi:hypothetical protein
MCMRHPAEARRTHTSSEIPLLPRDGREKAPTKSADKERSTPDVSARASTERSATAEVVVSNVEPSDMLRKTGPYARDPFQAVRV